MSGPFYKGLKIIKYLQLKNMCRHLILKPKQKEPDLRSDDVYKQANNIAFKHWLVKMFGHLYYSFFLF